MAANNYFGFTHGTPQYAGATNAAYQTQPPGYAVPPAQPQNNNVAYAQRPATGYEAYQGMSHAAPAAYTVSTAAPATPTYDYTAYARSAAVNATPAQYDPSKAYYQQQPAAVATTYATSNEYQSKPTHYNNNYSAPPRPNVNNQNKPAFVASAYPTNQIQAQPPASVAYSPQPNNTVPTIVSTTNVTPALTLPTVYPTPNRIPVDTTKAKPNVVPCTITPTKPVNSSWAGYRNSKAGLGAKGKPKTAPQPQQLQYCEVCKISCAGPQTFKEHLDGQRHKKKEALQKEGNAAAANNSKGHNLKCELCDVVCTGADAYAAHLKGSKHQKVVKLHTKLAKPIPDVDLQSALAAATGKTGDTNSNKKIFVQSSNLESVKVEKDGSDNETKDEISKAITEDSLLAALKAIAPVGLEYIEEIKNEDGKLITFNCKLCDCKFNDPNAKDMHMKGRRHRLQYKKKVNPDLVVDVKPSGRKNRVIEERLMRRDEYFRRREMDGIFWTDRIITDEVKRDEPPEWAHRPGGPPPPPPGHPGAAMGPPFPIRRPDTIDDRHFNLKHQSIRPTDKQFLAIHNCVSLVDGSLKETCDTVARKRAASQNTENKESNQATNGKTNNKSDGFFKGIVQVGLLPKNLFLSNDKVIEFVVIVSEYPTKSLLQSIYDTFLSLVKHRCKDKMTSNLNMDGANFTVTLTLECELSCVVYLTSPILRSQKDAELKSVEDGLIETACLESLALVRRTRWFHARPGTNPSSVMVIRILRDLCRRNPTWTPLGDWVVELLVDRVVGGSALTGAESLRKILEAIAGGIITSCGPGLADPCEREPTDAVGHLTSQQSCDITASAQHALRLFSFRQIHKVLGIDRIVPQAPVRFNRKRRLDNSVDGFMDTEIGKKDKREWA